jgi:aspartokinase/homoserine dehydrogenase 1
MFLDVRIVGIARPGSEIGVNDINMDGFSSQDVSRLVEKTATQSLTSNTAPMISSEVLHLLSRSSTPVVVDVSASEDTEALYNRCFSQGVNVVSSNAKSIYRLSAQCFNPVSRLTSMDSSAGHRSTSPVRLSRRGSSDQLVRIANTQGSFCFDNCIGGGLPILSTLRSMLRTGDKLQHVEAALSGSMNFLTSELVKGEAFSDAVQKAMEQRFTELNPLEDLSGVDIARKAIALCKLLGFHLTMHDIEVHFI